MDPNDYSSASSGRVLRTSKEYWVFIPNPLPPPINWSNALISALGEAERNLGRLASLTDTLPSPHILVRPFIRREAVLSSRIEGTRASLVDLYQYESAQLSFLEDTSDVHEVHNYVRAMDYGLERSKTLLVSLRLIREIHRILMENVRGEHLTPGEFRRSQNWIGPAGSTIESATLVPPPVDEMHQALYALEKFIHAPSDFPQLVRAGLIHYQFEVIHPFLDGNGRVGRLLMTLLLIEWGLISEPLLYLSAFFEAHRLDYYERLLAVSQRGGWENWLLFFLKGVSSQSLDAIGRIERLGKLRSVYRERLHTERASLRLLQTLDVLFQRPILNIRQLETALEVPYRTAQRYVERLVEIDILREVTGQARNRIYRADEILKVLESAGR
ncbi:MAG: cell filamentation protein Fic [Chloroflexi bacterium RBG_19FT_COMBO_50_10]|nr:MAG: cell filamentation protein Fic [Chloroflexi bacterium RBG_19FT_COMBO_50_10]